MSAAIGNGSGYDYDNFAGVRAGLRSWLGSAGPTIEGETYDLLVTGGAPGTTPVNTDNDDIATANQWIDNGETVRVDLVKDLNITGATTSNLTGINTPLDYFTVQELGVRLAEVKGNATSVDITLRAYLDEDGTLVNTGAKSIATDLTDDDPEVITQVEIIPFGATSGTMYKLGDGDVPGAVDWLADGGVEVFGVSESATVYVRTASGELSRLEVANSDPDGQDDFSIDAYSIRNFDAGDPIELSFDLALADGDDDTSVGTIGVTLTPSDII